LPFDFFFLFCLSLFVSLIFRNFAPQKRSKTPSMLQYFTLIGA
jgi:hypothetical protein